MNGSLTIPARFRGPPGSGNGGYVAGVFAELLDGEAEVTLRRPIPLDRPLRTARPDPDAALVEDDGGVIAELRRHRLELTVPAAPGYDAAMLASAASRSRQDGPYDLCFVCGCRREDGDGLRILAGPVAGRDLVAAPWTPHPGFAATDGRIAARHVWAALDCPGALAVDPAGASVLLLGRYATLVERRPMPGEQLVVFAWPLGGTGRRRFAGSALADRHGTLLARAHATWVDVTGRG